MEYPFIAIIPRSTLTQEWLVPARIPFKGQIDMFKSYLIRPYAKKSPKKQETTI